MKPRKYKLRHVYGRIKIARILNRMGVKKELRWQFEEYLMSGEIFVNYRTKI